MKRYAWMAGLALLAATGMGCGKSDSGDQRTTHIGPGGTSVSHSTTNSYGEHGSPNATPDKTVIEFLKAARSGDQHRLSSLMTDKAKDQTSKHNVNFELESYQNASFEVGEFEYLTKDKDSAHVACKWTDRDADGATFTHDVIWVLRKEDDGWRVAGMITRPFPDEPPVAFNYESFKELMEAKTSVEQESQRRMDQEQKYAKSPVRDGSFKK